MPKCEEMRLDSYKSLTKLTYMQIKDKEKRGTIKTVTRGTNIFVVLNQYAKQLISYENENYFEKKFEKVMPNEITYYGFMGKICQPDSFSINSRDI